MSYQISNNGASIKFQSTNGRVLLMKWAIKEIVVVRGDIIRISTENCQSGVFFHHKDVSTPVTASATALVNSMNGWLGSFTPPPGGPEE
jgi:hypothetical protein